MRKLKEIKPEIFEKNNLFPLPIIEMELFTSIDENEVCISKKDEYFKILEFSNSLGAYFDTVYIPDKFLTIRY